MELSRVFPSDVLPHDGHVSNCPSFSLVTPSPFVEIVVDCAMGNNAPHSSFVARHKPSFLVLASQISAAFIHGIVKILETGERPVHPFQILQVR